MTLLEFIAVNYENVKAGKARMIEATFDDGEVAMYTCGKIIRIDVKYSPCEN